MLEELLITIQQLSIKQLRALLTFLDTDPTISDFVEWALRNEIVPRLQFLKKEAE
jgi:hypothetical protein